MRLTRRYQCLPTYALCGQACGWPPREIPEDQLGAAAEAHVRATGHEVRIVTTSQVIWSAAGAAAAAQIPGARP